MPFHQRGKAPTPRRCPMVGGRQRPSSDGDSDCQRPASDRAGQPETRPAAGPVSRRHSVARQRALAARAARPSGLTEGKSRCSGWQLPSQPVAAVSAGADCQWTRPELSRTATLPLATAPGRHLEPPESPPTSSNRLHEFFRCAINIHIQAQAPARTRPTGGAGTGKHCDAATVHAEGAAGSVYCVEFLFFRRDLRRLDFLLSRLGLPPHRVRHGGNNVQRGTARCCETCCNQNKKSPRVATGCNTAQPGATWA